MRSISGVDGKERLNKIHSKPADTCAARAFAAVWAWGIKCHTCRQVVVSTHSDNANVLLSQDHSCKGMPALQQPHACTTMCKVFVKDGSLGAKCTQTYNLYYRL